MDKYLFDESKVALDVGCYSTGESLVRIVVTHKNSGIELACLCNNSEKSKEAAIQLMTADLINMLRCDFFDYLAAVKKVKCLSFLHTSSANSQAPSPIEVSLNMKKLTERLGAALTKAEDPVLFVMDKISAIDCAIDRMQRLSPNESAILVELRKDRAKLISSIHSVAKEFNINIDYFRCVAFEDLKYRLSLPTGDEARIGADELLDELNRISPPIKGSVPIPSCNLSIGNEPEVVAAISHLFINQRADIIKYLNTSCE